MSFRERRALERAWLYRDALLSIPRLKNAHACAVRDLSSCGAGLRLNRLPLLPDEFNPSFDGFRVALICRLIWRDGDFAGIAFSPASDVPQPR